jgi:hypothetical protein
MDDQWHLVCLSLDGKKASLYLDGAFLAENPLKGGVSPSGKVSLDAGSGNPRYYLDELRVYERPLFESEIKRLLAERVEE